MQRLILGFLIITAFMFMGCSTPSPDNSGNSNNNTETTTTLPLTNDVNLCAITLSEGSLTPAFNADTTSYTVSVANMVTKIKITGVQAQMTSSVSDPVNLTLDVDTPQTATIFVTSKSGSKKAYTVIVTRSKADSSNANLRGITLSSGTLSPVFSEGVTAYTTKLAFGESNIIVTGLKADSDAIVSPSVTLTNFVVGTAQTATIKVTSKDKTVKTYTVAVTMGEDGKVLLKNANLTSPVKLSTGSPTNALNETNVGDAVVTDETDDADPKVRYRVTTQKKTASASYDQSNILKPDTDVIYPGSVLLGESIDDGSYKEITSGVKRPITISYSLTGIVNGVVGKTLVPSLSATRAFHNEVMAQNIPGQSIPQFQFESIEVNTEESLDLKINAGVTYASVVTASVKAGYSYSKSNKKNKFLVKFSQTFYTVDIDQAGDKFLYESFDLKSFGGYRPVYVASVAYGRVGFLSVETTLDKKTFETTLAVACSYGPTTVEADVSVAKTKLNETSTIKINLIGGSTSPTTL
ncbi:MAG TPA: thiol-activated cytolysin family protein, partial [Spirochaetota bacterium]|nr:thiol-activated cytolysin family protein [Spirochaetota bacterium]